MASGGCIWSCVLELWAAMERTRPQLWQWVMAVHVEQWGGCKLGPTTARLYHGATECLCHLHLKETSVRNYVDMPAAGLGQQSCGVLTGVGPRKILAALFHVS